MEKKTLENLITNSVEILQELSAYLDDSETLLSRKAELKKRAEDFKASIQNILDFEQEDKQSKDPELENLYTDFINGSCNIVEDKSETCPLKIKKRNLLNQCKFNLGQELYIRAIQDIDALLDHEKDSKSSLGSLYLLKGHIQLFELGLYLEAKLTLEAGNQIHNTLYKRADELIQDSNLKGWAYENYLSQILREMAADSKEYQYIQSGERSTYYDYKVGIMPLSDQKIKEMICKDATTVIISKPKVPYLQEGKKSKREPDFVVLKKQNDKWNFFILDAKHYKPNTYCFDKEGMTDYKLQTKSFFKSLLSEEVNDCLSTVFIATNRSKFSGSTKAKQTDGSLDIPVFNIARNLLTWKKKVELMKMLISNNFTPTQQIEQFGKTIMEEDRS